MIDPKLQPLKDKALQLAEEFIIIFRNKIPDLTTEFNKIIMSGDSGNDGDIFEGTLDG